MKKMLLTVFVMVALCCLLALGVCAASTNEFGEVEELADINLKNMSTDTEARMVIVDSKGEYHTFPTGYILTNSTILGLSFNSISAALGEAIGRGNIVRIEVPSNITDIGYGGLSQCEKLVEIKFLENSQLKTVGGGGFYANPLLERINLPASLEEFTGKQIFNMCYALHTVEFAPDSVIEALPDAMFQNCSSLKKLVIPSSVKTLGKRLFDSSTVIDELYLSANLIDFGTEHFAWKQSGVLKIYAPAQLFENKDSVGINDFSWWENDKCLPSMVIFLTGTEAQANAIVQKSTYHKLTNATVSLWESGRTTDSYVPQSGWAIVYGYSACDAFYGGEHMFTGVDSAKVIDFFTEIKVGDMCTRRDCGVGTVSAVIEPIFENLGFSVSEKADKNGKYSIALGYKINHQAYGEYLEYGYLKYGFVIGMVDSEREPVSVINGIITAREGAYAIDSSLFAYNYADLKLVGVGENNNGKELVMCMYAFDGVKIKYLNENVVINVGA